MAQPVAPVENQEPAQNSKEYNFNALNQKLRQMEAEKAQAEARLQQLEQQFQSRAQARVEEEDDDEPYVDNKKLERKLSQFQTKMEQEFEKKAEMKARQLMEEERRQNYLKQNPDFSQVMSPEIVQKFAEMHPDLAESILDQPDSFARQKLVYSTIKKLGVDRPAAKVPSIQEKIDANRRSPYYQPSGTGAAPYAGQGDFSPSGQKNAYEKLLQLKNNLRL